MHNKTLTVAVALLLGAGLALAQPTLAGAGQAAPVGHAGKKMGKLANELGLTDAQKAQLKPIMENARAQREAIKGDASLAPADRLSKLRALREDTKQKMDAVLTSEQKAKLEQVKQERKEARKAKL